MAQATDFDPLDLDAQAKAQGEATQSHKNQAQTEADDVKWLMSSKRGRRIVWRLLDRAGVFRTSFSTNSMTMAFAEGARNAGLQLLAQVTEHCGDQFQIMLNEAKK